MRYIGPVIKRLEEFSKKVNEVGGKTCLWNCFTPADMPLRNQPLFRNAWASFWITPKRYFPDFGSHDNRGKILSELSVIFEFYNLLKFEKRVSLVIWVSFTHLTLYTVFRWFPSTAEVNSFGKLEMAEGIFTRVKRIAVLQCPPFGKETEIGIQLFGRLGRGCRTHLISEKECRRKNLSDLLSYQSRPLEDSFLPFSTRITPPAITHSRLLLSPWNADQPELFA